LAAEVTGKRFFNNYTEIMSTNNNKQLTSKYLHLIFENSKQNQFYKSKNVNKLSDYPILTKDIIRKEYLPLYVSKQYPDIVKNTSGGSTGEPVLIYQDRNYIDWSYATTMYYLQDIRKVNAFCKKVILWGSEKDIFRQMNLKGKIYNFLNNQIFLNSFMMDYDTIKKYISIINRQKPIFLKGYAGSLYEVAKVINKENIQVYSPRFIYSSAEELKDFMRKEIEDAFHSSVYDFYGSREVSAIAAEVNTNEYLAFSFDNFVEILDDNNEEVAPGEEGRVIITNLHNNYFPIIRYEIGDAAIKGEFNKEYNLPTLKKITGRTTDHFKTEEGKIIHGEYFTHLFYFREWVDLFQIVQNSIANITIFVVLNDGKEPNEKDKEDIDSKIKMVMGENIIIDWKFVSSIPKTKQGKHRYTMSNI
jgi:phenylacetate-CoA ligase